MPWQTPLAYTAALLPLYLALRWRFFKLPLHVDVGFYVSNDTICFNRWRYRNGWNARFAGGSKVLPEGFYTLTYLLHGPDGYKLRSRLYASLYNYLTAIAVGCLCAVLAPETDATGTYYLAGLTAFALISSQPHFGVYFENAELFELLPQVVGLLLIATGAQEQSLALLCVGCALWWLDAFFIKLSSVPPAAAVTVWLCWTKPGAAFPVIAVAVGVGLLHLVWLAASGWRWRDVVRSLWGHEQHLQHRLGLAAYVRRTGAKLKLLALIFRQMPASLAAVVLGLVVLDVRDGLGSLLIVYAVGVLAAYVFQAAHVWYYAIPLQPIAACCAASGAVYLMDAGPIGPWLLAAIVLAWLLACARRLAASRRTFEDWVWRVYAKERLGERNAALEQLVPELRSLIGDASLLIYGLANQAYVYTGRSYPINFVTPAEWLDEMLPDWQRLLNEKLIAEPPPFILDVNHRFDAEATAEGLGLVYQLERDWPHRHSLYRLIERRTSPPNGSCRTFRFPTPSPTGDL